MAGGNDTNGLTTALAMVGAMSEQADAAASQDELFEFEGPMTLPPIPRAPVGARGGRPAGARNKSTEQWRQYLLSRYRSPLVECLEILTRSPVELAKTWELYKWEIVDGAGETTVRERVLDTGAAASLQMQARLAALPYLHQRLPQAIEVTQKQLGHLTINLGADDADQVGDDLRLSGLEIDGASDR